MDFERSDTKHSVALDERSWCLNRRTQDDFVIRKNDVVQSICGAVAAECNATFGDRVVSLIITGSAARGEATIVNSGNNWKLLGDAEFLVVVRRRSGTADAACAEAVKRDSAKKLADQGIEVPIDLAVVDVSYLKNLPPHIFSYELRACGRIILGHPGILGLIPQFTARDISREDAWRLLCNRMIEQLEFVDELERSALQLTPRLHYATIKLHLDMATSYLAFCGNYAPTYRERAERLAAFAEKAGNDAPFPLKKFAIRVAECTSWKLTGDEVDCDRRVELWREAINYMRRLWRWEMIQLTNSRDELTIAGLSARLASQQRMEQRLRGWISLVKRRGWLKSSPQWPRWASLAFHSTPRYLVYQVAAEIAFRLPCLVKHSGQASRLDVAWDKIQALLPERAPQSNSRGDAVWRRLVGDVLWNYGQFLQNTRA